MGYYTESHFKFTLRSDTPKEILDVLEGGINGGIEYYASLLSDTDKNKQYILDSIKNNTGLILSVADTPNLPIEHPFGKCTRWNQFLTGTFKLGHNRVQIDSDIKMYMQEAQKFLQWLAPYIVKKRKKQGTYLGWTKGEDQTDQCHWYLEEFLDPESFTNKYLID